MMKQVSHYCIAGQVIMPETAHPLPFHFNGGKVEHVFEFDDETRSYKDSFTSTAAQEALEHCDTRFFYKIDGSNGVIRVEKRENGNETILYAYQRLDTRTKPPPEHCIPLPETCGNASTYTGHSYYYEPITLQVHGKKLLKRNRGMLEVVERHREILLSYNQEYVAIEWVGAKFNKTPGVDCDVALSVHEQQRVSGEDIEAMERTHAGVKRLLLEADPPIEGLILEHNNTFYKIRSDSFDKKCRFKTNPETVRPPIYLS